MIRWPSLSRRRLEVVARPGRDAFQLIAGLQQTGATLLFALLFVWMLDVAILLIGASLDQSLSLLILIFASVLAVFVSRQLFFPNWLFSFIWPLVIVAVSAALAATIYDTTIDGQHYHFQAIYAFANGWNPFVNSTPPAIGDPAEIWVSHYPTASWLITATLLKAGLPLEATKCINLIALVSSGLILLGAVSLLGFQIAITTIFVVVATMNPIVLAELFSHMNDGLLASFILIFAACATVWAIRGDRIYLIVAIAAMLLSLNLKFSAVPIFVFFSAAVVAGNSYVHGFQAGWRTASLLLLSGMLGILLFGASPYVLNFMRFGHPFYPVMGAGSVDIMATNTPEVLAPFSSLGRFLFSLFAETHSGYGAGIHLKWPFMTNSAELRAAGGADVRIGGFGPFFSGALVIALLLTPLALRGSRRSPAVVVLLGLALGVALSVFVMPQNWWARYVPQLWLVPVILAGVLVATRVRWLRISGICVATLMLLDAAITGGAAIFLAVKRSDAVAQQIHTIQTQSRPVCISAGYAQSRIAILRAAGIEVRSFPQSSTPLCATPVAIASYGPDRVGGEICPCIAR